MSEPLPTDAPVLRRLPSQAVVVGLLTLAAALVVLLALWLPGSGQDQSVAAVQAAAEEPDEGGAAQADDVDVDDANDLDAVPVVTYEVYLARDPFDPVVPEDEPELAAPAPDDPDGADPDDPDAPAPDDPDAPDADPDDPNAPDADPTVPPEDDPDRCVGEEEIVCNGQVVSLLDIVTENGERVAVIQVDSTVYEVRTDEVFAERFRLLDIGTEQVTLQFGDEVRRLPMGEHVLK
jgi:hypothetical protein